MPYLIPPRGKIMVNVTCVFDRNGHHPVMTKTPPMLIDKLRIAVTVTVLLRVMVIMTSSNGCR